MPPTAKSSTPQTGCAAISAGRDAREDVAARLRIELEVDQLAVAGFLEQLPEGLETVVVLVEAGLPALDRLLDHGTPDLFLGIAFRKQVFGRLHQQFDALLAPVIGRSRRL